MLQVGHEILIEAVVQAIPTYTMSCFKLSKGLIKEIEVLIRKFWWGYRGEQKKTHWMSWEKYASQNAMVEWGLGN